MPITRLVEVGSREPDATAINEAAAILKSGGLVAFPTETVYGLGALALAEDCVRRIFEAKGRPETNPIIVHVADSATAQKLCSAWPSTATSLAKRFWPGPLTLVLPKSEIVPAIVTAGGATVAVRCPAHPVALALLKATGEPIAAPSANPSNYLSPTTADHVRKGLEGKIDLILDGGPTTGGIESTVVEVADDGILILRSGLISSAELEDAVTVPVRMDVRTDDMAAVHKSPGRLSRHYSPRTPISLASDSNDLARLHTELCNQRYKVGVMQLGCDTIEQDVKHAVRMPNRPSEYAARLYAELHKLDDAGLDRILVQLPPETAAWRGVIDRLKRAAGTES